MKKALSTNGKTYAIVILAALFLLLYYGIKPERPTTKHRFYPEMAAAAEKMQRLQQEVRQEMLRRGIEIDPAVDRLESGLIGLEWSGITTTLGNLESKRTTVNPDFAALLVRLFKEAGLQKGDCITANCSSSFPALNLAFIAAADTLELNAVMVTSVGASTYGGNREDFTYLDMERHLYGKKLIQNKTLAYSLGGAGDTGKEFEAEVIDPIKKRLDGYGLIFLYEADFEKNLAERYALYMNAAPTATAASPNAVKAFINIGGNLLSLGDYTDSIDTEKIRLPAGTAIQTGLVGKFLQAGVPVFYLLNIKSIALYYQLPFDPLTLPEIGTAPIYYCTGGHFRNYLILALFAAALILNRASLKTRLDF